MRYKGVEWACQPTVKCTHYIFYVTSITELKSITLAITIWNHNFKPSKSGKMNNHGNFPSHHITSYHITSYPHHITSHHITITSRSHHFTSHHIASHHITSRSHHDHITITSYHITITSHHITITSHHIIIITSHQSHYFTVIIIARILLKIQLKTSSKRPNIDNISQSNKRNTDSDPT
jgi:hypothetical protein